MMLKKWLSEQNMEIELIDDSSPQMKGCMIGETAGGNEI
jgi:hypothetical protein